MGKGKKRKSDIYGIREADGRGEREEDKNDYDIIMYLCVFV